MADTPNISADAEQPYRTYVGADGVERRYVLCGNLPFQLGFGREMTVSVEVIPLGGDHDFNALARTVLAQLHSFALHFGDIAVSRKITMTFSETVGSIR